MSSKKKDYTGMKVGLLTALESTDKRKNGSVIWRFECECGNDEYYVVPNDVIHNFNKNKNIGCGCLTKEVKHGMSRTRFYRIWMGIKSRCLNRNSAVYCNYEAKGIEISEEWMDFENFIKDMYKSYVEHCDKHGVKNTTIDRIDTNGNYELNNCRWATYSVQILNQNRNKKQKYFKAISPDGKEYIHYNQAEFARQHALIRRNIGLTLSGHQKTHKGWRFEYTEVENQ